jgi:PPOX class probable FMN-dependent enzyme
VRQEEEAQMTTSETVTQNRFSDTFGYPAGRAATKVKPEMTPYVQEFISHSPFAVMASSDPEGNCDASPKGGKPGFVRVLDDRHLLFPDVAGNRLFQSYQNVEDNPSIGLIFFIPGLNDTVRVNGRASIVGKEELDNLEVAVSLYEMDDRSHHLQGVVIEVEESYGHCPRAFTFSKLWDTETIAANQNSRPVADRSTNV